MLINRYNLENNDFTDSDRKMFSRLQVLTNLSSAITKSIVAPDGTYRIVYHCDAGEAVSYLNCRAGELEKSGRGNSQNYRSLSLKIAKNFSKNDTKEGLNI